MGAGFGELDGLAVLVFLLHGGQWGADGERFSEGGASEEGGRCGGEELGDRFHLLESCTGFEKRNLELCSGAEIAA